MSGLNALKNPVCGLGVAAGAGLLLMAVAAIPPRTSLEEASVKAPQLMQSPDAERLNESIPGANAVLAKHLFVPDRKATGLNSFPDLVVKGIFIGKEQSAIFSLKSKPQANLRVWLGDVESCLSGVTDPRDPRQDIVTFLREWPIQKIELESVTVEHFITGEVETYDVDYVAAKKVADDAARGYGQGIMSQEAVAKSKTQKKAQTNTSRESQRRSEGGGPPPDFMADRVSSMLSNMNEADRSQFMKKLNQQVGGTQNKSSTKNTSNKNSSKSNNSKTKK